MKEYIIKVTQTEEKDNVPFKFHMSRENNGFNVYEMIGFISLIKNELVLQAISMFDNSDIKRLSNYKDEEIHINIENMVGKE